jgi:hypothetical protein
MAAQNELEESSRPVDIEEAQVDSIEDLRLAPGEEDADGQPLWPSQKPAANSQVGKASAAAGSLRHPRCSQPPRSTKAKPFAPRPSRGEVEQRITEAHLWPAQRLPLIRIRENAAQNWGVTNTKRWLATSAWPASGCRFGSSRVSPCWRAEPAVVASFRPAASPPAPDSSGRSGRAGNGAPGGHR